MRPQVLSVGKVSQVSPRPLHIFVLHGSDLFTDYLPHGDGRAAYNFVTRIAGKGHHIYVATQRAELRQPLPPNVHLTVIESRFSNPLLVRLDYMRQVRQLLRQLSRTVCFDLIHQLNPVFTGLSLAAFDSPLPLVLGFYVPHWLRDPETLSSTATLRGRTTGWFRDRLAAVQQRFACILLLTTPAALKRIPNPSAVGDKIRYLGQGVDIDLFSPVPEQELEARLAEEHKHPSVLFLANISERKGIFTLLSAMQCVLEQLPLARLRIAGSGPDLERVMATARQLRIENQVDYLGQQEHAATAELFRQNAVYCLPSFGEPFATSALEAMSCGRALVITDSGGLPYLVPEEGSLRIPNGDVKALATALLELLRNPKRRTDMGAANRRNVLEKRTWPKIIAELEAIYYEILPAEIQG